MAFSTVRAFAVSAALLMVCAMPGQAHAKPERSGWYVGGGVGMNWTSSMDQVGWNLDTYCYPGSCAEPGLSQNIPGVFIPGYRWRYDLDMDVGNAFEFSAGRVFNRLRLEVSAAQRKNDIDQKFADITTLNGKSTDPLPVGSEDHRVASNATARIDDLTARTLSLNAYYDFTDIFPRVTPYLGVGVGVAFVEISGLFFSADYRDLSDPSRDLSFFNSAQDADFSDTVLVGHLYAGADYSLTDDTLLGVKLTYSTMDDLEQTGHYLYHPAHTFNPDFTNHNNFSGPQQWSLMFTAKYLFGG